MRSFVCVPQEALRILGESINIARKGQLTLRPLK
jgi:hypothetical protein